MPCGRCGRMRGGTTVGTRSRWICYSLCVVLVVGQLSVPEAVAAGKRGGHPGGGGAKHPPRLPAPHHVNKPPSFKPPKMSVPRAKPHPRTNTNLTHANHAQPRTNVAKPHVNPPHPHGAGTAAKP